MAEPEEGFRVTDRRRRDDEEEPVPTTARLAESPISIAEAAPAAAEEPRAAPRADDADRAGPDAPERNLSGLFMMLASEAVIALGDAPDPVTGQRHRELDHAAGVIDLLMLLREKTEGNRSPEETQVIDELLYDLQLRYVNATKRPG
jgi:Domain of unknown function (DUF1844)